MVWLYVIGYIVMGLISIILAVESVKQTYGEEHRSHLRKDQGARVAFIIVNFLFWWVAIPGHIVYNHASTLGKELKK